MREESDPEGQAFEAVLRQIRIDQLRAQWTLRLRREKGAEWVEENKELLDWQFQYLTECNFI